MQTEATVEIQDAKGIKIFKKTLTTDEYGMVTAELPLSERAQPGRVEALGLRRRRLHRARRAGGGDTSFPSTRSLPSSRRTGSWWTRPITGHVTTKYSYGRAVEGELKVTATRYVGEWEEYATYTAHIDGEGDFTIEPAEYVAGVAEAGGTATSNSTSPWWRSPPATNRPPPS